MPEVKSVGRALREIELVWTLRLILLQRQVERQAALFLADEIIRIVLEAEANARG